MLIVAGDQVPTTPFGATGDKVGATVPAQKVGIEAKLDANAGITVTDKL